MSTKEENVLIAQKKMWENYLFLSKELIKFSKEKDIDIIDKLLNDREKVQNIIKGWDEQFFLKTEEGGKLKEEIMLLDKKILRILQSNANFFRQAVNISDAYGGGIFLKRKGAQIMDFGV